jgi:hypothetical protein
MKEINSEKLFEFLKEIYEKHQIQIAFKTTDHKKFLRFDDINFWVLRVFSEEMNSLFKDNKENSDEY